MVYIVWLIIFRTTLTNVQHMFKGHSFTGIIFAQHTWNKNISGPKFDYISSEMTTKRPCHAIFYLKKDDREITCFLMGLKKIKENVGINVFRLPSLCRSSCLITTYYIAKKFSINLYLLSSLFKIGRFSLSLKTSLDGCSIIVIYNEFGTRRIHTNWVTIHN